MGQKGGVRDSSWMRKAAVSMTSGSFYMNTVLTQ